jgi:hypothetical protein
VPWLIGVAVLAVEQGAALGQSNLDAGKSPAQIFSTTCAACHRSPRELRPTSAGYLLDHYSTGGREAAAMAGYLAAVGSDARAVQQRRPPVLGAGQGSPAEAGLRPSQTAPGADPANGLAVKPRRPADSVELGRLLITDASAGATENPPSHTAGVPSAPLSATEPFEE